MIDRISHNDRLIAPVGSAFSLMDGRGTAKSRSPESQPTAQWRSALATEVRKAKHEAERSGNLMLRERLLRFLASLFTRRRSGSGGRQPHAREERKAHD